MTAHAAVDCAPVQWHGADSVAQWPPVMKALLKECEILVKNAEGPCVEASVDIFCRICELRGRCASLPTAPMLLACVRCDSLHSWFSVGWLMMQALHSMPSAVTQQTCYRAVHACGCYLGRWSRRDIALRCVGPCVAAFCRSLAGATQTLRGASADWVSQQPAPAGNHCATSHERAPGAATCMRCHWRMGGPSAGGRRNAYSDGTQG